MKRCMSCMAEYSDALEICPYCGYEEGSAPDNSLHMRPGVILAGRYLVGTVLGFGGFGVTYVGWDQVLKQKVAIKEYLPSEFATRMIGQSQITVFGGKKQEQFDDGMGKFVDEAKRLAKFQNEPGIVRIYDSFTDNHTAYIVMECLEGETLTSYLEREKTLTPDKAIEMLLPIIRSLEVVHQAGIVHRDIAPDNIFLTTDGQVKLIDFGAARYATTSHSRSLTVIIKPGYSPEEQYRSRGDQGPYTDVYAVGAVLYRMITGITPPDALERRAFLENRKKDILEPPSKYAKVSKKLENSLLNAMNIQIEDRTPTAQVLLEELTSQQEVVRKAGRVKALYMVRWPLWAKITIPICLAAVLTLCVLLFTGRIGFMSNLITDITLGKDMTRVPSVINYSVSTAQEQIEKSSLEVLISDKVFSETIPVDMVIAQDVAGGSVVSKGTVVEVNVSAGGDTSLQEGVMPDVTYYTVAKATQTLQSVGLTAKLEYVFNDSTKTGLVIWQSLASGEAAPPGTEITLRVSKGKDPNKKDQLSVSPEYMNMYVEDTVSLSASGGSGSYQWRSSNTAVVSVSSKGAAKAVGAGTAVITVTSGEETVTCTVTVKDYTLTLNYTSLSTTIGEVTYLQANGLPNGVAVSWSTSNSSVAAVNSDGRIEARGQGTAVITASGKGRTATCRVEVKDYVLSLNCDTISMLPGAITYLEVSGLPSGKKASWSSSDTSVVTVDSNGAVAASRAGSATVYVSDGSGKSASCDVVVRNNDWSTTELSAENGLQVETKTQYRYQDKETTTSADPVLSDWTQYDKQVTYGEWGSWSEWKDGSTCVVSDYDTADVETRTNGSWTQYTLYQYKYWNENKGMYYYTYAAKGTKRTVLAPASECTPYKNYEGHQSYSCDTGNPQGDNIWFIESSVDFANTQSRVRYREAYVNYCYYRWGGWSSWQDEAVSGSDTRNVETRTLYRYQ